MKLWVAVGFASVIGLGVPRVHAAVLTSAHVTEIRNDVRYQPADAAERAAQISDQVRETDVLRTGERSLAELEFNDKTITRLGSLSVFSFNRETREFRAGKGTMLICVPKGVGGGRIVTLVAVTNSRPRVLSTVIFLEGSGLVYRTGDAGRTGVPIGAGQMITQFADTPGLTQVRRVDLRVLLGHARIIHGFSTTLPSLPIIQTVINQQQADLQQGNLQHGGGGNSPGLPPTPTTLQVFDTAQQSRQFRPVIYSVGDGFYLSTLPIPGYNSAPLEGGGYICRPKH